MSEIRDTQNVLRMSNLQLLEFIFKHPVSLSSVFNLNIFP